MEITDMQSLFRFPRIVGLFVALLMIFSARAVFAQALLRNGDTLELRISGVPAEEVSQFSAPYTVDDNGALNLPYIGSIKVAGMLVNQAQTLIETKLKNGKIFTQPTITLNLAQTARFVNVGGQVRSPQRVPYTPDLTLMSAINAAGGFNDYADKKSGQICARRQIGGHRCAQT